MRHWFFFSLPMLAALIPASAVGRDPRPTVVFETGLGDGAKVWRGIIAGLGKDVPTFAYARPGYEGTPVTDAPRDPCTIAAELHTRLAAAGRAPPYLLVGHSLGGQYAYAFARLYPQKTAGLLLVDATPPGHWQGMQEQTPGAVAIVKALRAVAFSRTMRREFDAQDQCLDHLPRTPLPFATRILVKTRPDAGGGERLFQMDRDLAMEWVRMTGASKIELADGSGHYIQRERPAIVIEAIRQLMTVAAGLNPPYTAHPRQWRGKP